MKRLLWASLCCLFSGSIILLSAWPPSTQAQTPPQHPFPQHVAYAANTIKPTNFTQSQMDQHVRDYYNLWKQNYVVPAGTNSAGKQMYRVAFGQGSSVTVSEGQGYGMVIVALMAGYDSNAQTIFDGLWYFSREFPSGQDSRLMSWKIDNGQIVDGNSSAFDGDADIAYGLLLANAQWGSSSTVNYTAAANTVIAGILESTIGPASRLPTLGDWVNPNGSPHNQYTPRSSDFMPAHFRAYGRATNNSVWNQVVANSQTAINAIQTNYSGATGLLPDFLKNCNTSCQPAHEGFLEGPHDDEYYYNAGRDPWRLGTDVLLNNDPISRAQVEKMIDWLAGVTNGQAQNIKAGYSLNGTPIGTYYTIFFAAPFGVAAMTDPAHQTFLNNIYANVYNQHEGYYGDTVALITLLIMTGNYWDPTQTSPAPTPTPTATSLPGQTPYGGTPWMIPGTIQAENYDLGGEGIAYHDTTGGNSGNTYRNDRVDIEGTTDSGGGYNVGWISGGEWLEYTANVTPGAYQVEVRVAALPGNPGDIVVKLDGQTLGTIDVTTTGGWQNWATKSFTTNISQGGTRILRLQMVGSGYNVNWVRFTSTTTPTPTATATPSPTPGSGMPCVVDYNITQDWGSGSTIEVSITNNAATAVNGWTLAFNFPGNQTITSLWNGIGIQTGAAVSVSNAGWNPIIAPNGGVVSFGFNVNYSGSNGTPAAFTLNGAACSQ